MRLPAVVVDGSILHMERLEREGRGVKIIERPAKELRPEFHDMKGFSPRNMLFMRAFAEAYTDGAIVKQLVSQLQLGHVVRLLQKIKSPEEHEWYIRKAFEHDRSRGMLVRQP